MERLDDAVVDGVAVQAAGPGDRFVTQGRAAPGQEVVAMVVAAFFTVHRRDEAEFLLEGIDRHESRGTDGRAFDYVGHDSVALEVGAGHSVVVSEAAFGRLMARWRAALDAGAPAGP